jgi:hypothetical protein
MADEWTDGQKTRIAVAELIGALVKTLGETDTTIPVRFKGHLEQAYYRVKSYEDSQHEVLEAIRWCAETANK